MTILVLCDHPACMKQIAGDRVDALGRLHVRPPWVIYGGARTLTVCCPEHAIEAAKVQGRAPPLPDPNPRTEGARD